MKKSYCTQNNGDCDTCSLVNYGRDCRNIPLKEPTKKLPYDIPIRIAEMLKADAQKEVIPATQLLIKLIEQNHLKEEFKMLEQRINNFNLMGEKLSKGLIKKMEKVAKEKGLEFEIYTSRKYHSFDALHTDSCECIYCPEIGDIPVNIRDYKIVSDGVLTVEEYFNTIEANTSLTYADLGYTDSDIDEDYAYIMVVEAIKK